MYLEKNLAIPRVIFAILTPAKPRFANCFVQVKFSNVTRVVSCLPTATRSLPFSLHVFNNRSREPSPKGKPKYYFWGKGCCTTVGKAAATEPRFELTVFDKFDFTFMNC